MKKTTKSLLFERMNTIGGMPVNERIITKEELAAAANESNYAESPSYQVKLDNISICAQQLHDVIESMDDLPAWVQDKITISEHNMIAIHDWINSQAHGNE